MEIIKEIIGLLSSMLWPGVALYALYLFKEPISHKLSGLASAELPGGTKLSFQQELNSANEIALDIEKNPDPPKEDSTKISMNNSNTRLVELGLRPSPSGLNLDYYSNQIAYSPTTALSGLRVEVDIMIRNLADGYKISCLATDSPSVILSKLHQNGSIYTRQYNLGIKVLALCNSAIHGATLSVEDAQNVINIAKVLVTEYLDWLSWGFADK